MNRTIPLLAALLLVAAGCNDPKSTPAGTQSNTTVAKAATTTTTTTTATAMSEEDQIKANLAMLSPEDRALAEKQKYCVEQPDERLGGEMGVPIKLMIKGEAVFICCKGCEKHALKDPDRTLAKAKELKEKAAKEK
jgi:hypothetical protein